MQRVYDSEIVEGLPLWLISLMIENDPLINQSEDIALEYKGIAELKFSLN
jgi:hypothetical protein